MIVATRPEPTARPPSRSDLAVVRNLFVTVFENNCERGCDTVKVKVHTTRFRVECLYSNQKKEAGRIQLP